MVTLKMKKKRTRREWQRRTGHMMNSELFLGVPPLYRSQIMKKRILIACLVALIGVWIALVMLGKNILPGAPVQKAWIVPLGSSGWEYVMMGVADEGMTREALTRILGTPNDVTISTRHLGQVYLHYTNQHDSKRDVSFAVSADQKIMYAAPGSP